MSYELVASRILAPSTGSSIYVWASVIGVIIAALSLGYKAGGILADSRSEPTAFYWIRPSHTLTIFYETSVFFSRNRLVKSGSPVKCVFDGIIDIKLFNDANEGKATITEDQDGKLTIQRGTPPSHLVNKGVRNSEFAFRKYVLCPDCRNPLLV